MWHLSPAAANDELSIPLEGAHHPRIKARAELHFGGVLSRQSLHSLKCGLPGRMRLFPALDALTLIALFIPAKNLHNGFPLASARSLRLPEVQRVDVIRHHTAPDLLVLAYPF